VRPRFEDALAEEDFLTLLNPPMPTGAPIQAPSQSYSPLRNEPLSAEDWAAARAWGRPVGRDIYRG
jgi:hypothetical protein